jgi:hypothetical protein
VRNVIIIHGKKYCSRTGGAANGGIILTPSGVISLSRSTKAGYKERQSAVPKLNCFSNLAERWPFPLDRTNGLQVVHTGGITQRTGDATSFGFIGISEIARSLP